MEFGISLPGRGPLAKPDQVLTMAARADALGYASIFVTDHVVLPASMARSVYPYSTTRQLPGGAAQDYLEPLALLGTLARATRRARLGTSVLVVPYRHPLVTAKMLATLDRLSGGRIILGAGVGWLREEFEALGAPPFEERGSVTDEYLAFMRQTWTTDPVTFRGRYVSVSAVHALPKPVQPNGIPVWIGGHTDAAVRRAARLGDGWHPIILRPPGLLLPEVRSTTSGSSTRTSPSKSPALAAAALAKFTGEPLAGCLDLIARHHHCAIHPGLLAQLQPLCEST